MKLAARLLIAIPFLGSILSGETAESLTTQAQNAFKAAQHDVIFAPTPDYPRSARRKFSTGKGVVVLRFDTKTGAVEKAAIAVSTGDRDLDDAALAAFRRWRVKPHGRRELAIPIRFGLEWPNETYVYRGLIKTISPQTHTVRLLSRGGFELNLIVNSGTALTKNGRAISFGELAPGDRIYGQARVSGRREAIAASGTVTSGPQN
jgi:TonB family protein